MAKVLISMDGNTGGTSLILSAGAANCEGEEHRLPQLGGRTLAADILDIL